MSTKGHFVTMSITVFRLNHSLLLHRNKNLPNYFKKFYNSRVVYPVVGKNSLLTDYSAVFYRKESKTEAFTTVLHEIKI